MPRWALVVLLAAGVLCGAGGTALVLQGGSPAGFGWTAYSPLTSSASAPAGLASGWQQRVGAVVLALGAGFTGAAAVALLLTRRGRAARGA